MAKKPTTLKELFDFAATKAVEIFNDSGEILPMWHCILGTGEHALIATPWNDPEEKEQTVIALRQMFAQKQVKRYVFFTEAWTVVCDNKVNAEKALEVYREKGLKAHPDRREIVLVKAEDRDGTTIRGHFFILRPEHGKPSLSPLHLDDHISHATGLMEGLLA